jgi:hypothetical protein
VIVDSYPCRLVVVFSDADMQRFVERFIERGQERGCLERFDWRSIRDSRRDPFVVRPGQCVVCQRASLPLPRLLLLWDHVGSGREEQPPTEVERGVVETLSAQGWPTGHVEAIAVVPELEIALLPVWGRVKAILAAKRSMPAPEDWRVLSRALRLVQRHRRGESLPDDFCEALRSNPKEVFQGLIDLLNLRLAPQLFEELGEQLSIPTMKGMSSAAPGETSSSNVAARVSDVLERWFPGGGGHDHHES